MEESKLDIMAPKEEQLKILIPYLEEAMRYNEGEEPELPITPGTKVLISRYLWNWFGLYTRRGITAKGAFLYYKKLIEEK